MKRSGQHCQQGGGGEGAAATSRPVVADLFAGAGGLTAGFREADYVPVAAVENDRWAAQTYAANFGDHVLTCPIEEVVVRRVGSAVLWHGRNQRSEIVDMETPEVDVVVGGHLAKVSRLSAG